jgi:hypothetical protein
MKMQSTVAMLLDQKNPESVRPGAARHAEFRIGVYVGTALAMALIAWVIIANRVPFLEPFDRERNLAATTVIGLFALVPIIRYMNAPRSLLLSGLAAWSILSFAYTLLCLYFPGLSGIRTPTQVLMFGALFYLISATVAWMISLVWRVRQSRPPHSRVNR